MNVINLSDKEADTVLAALRMYQMHSRQMPQCYLDIAENGREGADACLNASEIDDLCDRINCGE